uniref:Uncharacterized protein n=1 Tax=Yersinia enterocolitica TaxID=630 RepID=B0RKM1_YEREN|nr:hypothetical protein [Yersinia enterocolitica]
MLNNPFNSALRICLFFYMELSLECLCFKYIRFLYRISNCRHVVVFIFKFGYR